MRPIDFDQWQDIFNASKILFLFIMNTKIIRNRTQRHHFESLTMVYHLVIFAERLLTGVNIDSILSMEQSYSNQCISNCSKRLESNYFTIQKIQILKVGFRIHNSFCIPITFNNPLKACISNKKYLITIQKRPTQNVKVYF